MSEIYGSQTVCGYICVCMHVCACLMKKKESQANRERKAFTLNVSSVAENLSSEVKCLLHTQIINTNGL